MLRFLAKTNWTVTGLTVCAVLFTQSAGVAYFGVGAVVCTVTVKLLKRILRQPRPARHSQKKKTYGMPSTHSASITYFAVFIPLACAYLPIHPSLPLSPATCFLPLVIIFPWAFLVILSRVWLAHHTWPQVAVGSAYGAAFAYLWFKIWAGGLNGYGQIAEEWFRSRLREGILPRRVEKYGGDALL